TYPNVTFVVSDGLEQVSQVTTIIIQPNPQPPTFGQPANVTAAEGDPIQFQLRASDPNGAPLIYSSDMLPPGASLDPVTVLFTWTPAFDQFGPFNVTFTATKDNGTGSPLTVSQTVAINVLPVDRRPLIPLIPDQAVQGGGTLDVPVQATDPDSDKIKLSVTG